MTDLPEALLDLRAALLSPRCLILVEIFLRHVVFWELAGSDFSFIGIISLLHTFNSFSFEGVSLIEQFTDAFRIRTLNLGQTLRI